MVSMVKKCHSLKNFITVPEIMQQYTHTHNQIRMLFLLHTWSDTMEYSEETINMLYFSLIYSKTSSHKLQTKSILIRPTTKHHKKFGQHEMKFFEYLEKVKLDVDKSLRKTLARSIQ